MTTGDGRSVQAGGNIIGSIIQTGDHNRATLKATQLPPAASVDLGSAVASLREELLAIDTPDSAKIARALDDLSDEAGKVDPDRQEVANSLERALGFASKAADFADRAGRVKELVVQVGGWLGAASPYVAPLLAVVGLTPA